MRPTRWRKIARGEHAENKTLAAVAGRANRLCGNTFAHRLREHRWVALSVGHQHDSDMVVAVRVSTDPGHDSERYLKVTVPQWDSLFALVRQGI